MSAAPRIFGFHYSLTDSTGNILDESDEDPLYFMEGAQQIIPGLENQMKDMQVGDKAVIHVPFMEAYGPRLAENRLEVPREQLPPGDIQVGDVFRPDDAHGHPVTVTQVTQTHVILDANHPLAGVDLTFDIEVVEIREATKDEMAHGHAHGPHGHHH